jgi:hypothetical protein
VPTVKSTEDGLEYKVVNPTNFTGIPDTFLDLTDTPTSYTGQSGKILQIPTTEDKVVFDVVKRGSMEYPTENVTFCYLIVIGKATMDKDEAANCWFTVDSFADKCMSCLQQVGAVTGDPRGLLLARKTAAPEFYRVVLHAPAATADHFLQKYVAGSFTTLATEAVDLDGEAQFTESLSISGSSLKAWRQGIRDLTATPTLSATDTAIASGKWGGRNEIFFAEFLPPASPPKKAIAYF